MHRRRQTGQLLTPISDSVAGVCSGSPWLLMIWWCVLLAGCVADSKTQTPSRAASGQPLSSVPTGLDSATAARLTETLESEHFVFHRQPGDTVWVDRQEAFHRWAVDYLGISLPKKIDYYKFSIRDMRAAVGRGASGRAFPQNYALATIYEWHPHEAMHIYTFGLCQRITIRLYDEGMAVAHEFDPLDGNWVSARSAWSLDGGYVYAEEIQEHRAAGSLYPIDEILDSRAFDEVRRRDRRTVNQSVLYDEAGMFVSYLVDTFGIDKMKQAICSVTESDTRDTILRRFEAVFGLSVQEAERAWLAYLDALM